MRNRDYTLLLVSILSFILVCSALAGTSPNLYRNKDHAFSIMFPPGWQQRTGQTPSTVVVSENQQGDSIVIQVRPMPQNVNFENFADSELKALINDIVAGLQRKFDDIMLHDSGITHINNTKAIWMLYSYSNKQAFATIKVTTMHYQVFHEGRLLSILCTSLSGRYKQVSNTFLNSVRTFIFENPSWYGK